MTRFAATLMMLLPAVALAQTVEMQLHNEVPAGQKPSLTVKPAVPVTRLQLSLTRDDGKSFAAEHGPLRVGQSATLGFGDSRGGHFEWKGKLVAIFPDGNRESFELVFKSATTGDLKVTYARDHLDLEAHRLDVRLSRPAARAELAVIADDGQVIGGGLTTFHGEPAGSWLRIGWTPTRAANVLRLELRATSSDGLTTTVRLTPWTVGVPHDEVNFEFGKA